jgi:hypothetical protein
MIFLEVPLLALVQRVEPSPGRSEKVLIGVPPDSRSNDPDQTHLARRA